MLVDNITYVNGSGQIQNSAERRLQQRCHRCGTACGVAGMGGRAASSVVIYELDTPIVTDDVASDSLAVPASQSLAPLFAATDPANKTIT